VQKQGFLSNMIVVIEKTHMDNKGIVYFN